MKRIIPYPLLTLSLLLMWMILNGFTLGQGVIGIVVGIAGGFLMRLLKPQKVHIHNWGSVIKLFFRVTLDIVKSNYDVALYVLFSGAKRKQSGFITVPLELKNHTGLAVLSCIMTATPGTAWIAYHSKESSLLVHILDLDMDNENYWRDFIKNRYESLLLEIFQ
ncbi:Na+/H+ antiporter subunit E [Bartonella sp. M0283]|uniref:Na+/H+ antiporter subunit E n=1 Tax=Bartonella sp. M0283 TaxID=2751016 RepID=UPI0018DCDEC8|nr:Na+/H+ antiporter subunit E [Bartonella sp. M0283]MBI0163877.1 Na+/H+ antiporter subunit E [Bartonella sp. M0283]